MNTVSKKLLKEFIHFGGSTILFHTSKVLIELYVAKNVGPEIWGTWYLYNMILAYRTLFESGITSGMNREIPILIGKKNDLEVENLQNTVYTFLFFSCFIVALILCILHFFITSSYPISIFWVIPLFIAVEYYYFVQINMKSKSLFRIVSIQQIAFSFFYFTFNLIAIFYFKFSGFVIASTISFLIANLAITKYYNLKYNFRFNKEEIKLLIKVGFPIMMVGIAYTFLNTADRWVIQHFMDVKQLGYYSIAILVFGVLTTIPKIISQQFYPRMAVDWGESAKKSNLLNWVKKQRQYYLVVCTLLVVVVFFGISYIIESYLPDYKNGILSIKIISIGVLFMPISAGWGNFLNIMNKQKFNLYAIVFAIVTNLILNIIFVKNGLGLVGISLGTVVAFILYHISINIIGNIIYRKI